MEPGRGFQPLASHESARLIGVTPLQVQISRSCFFNFLLLKETMGIFLLHVRGGGGFSRAHQFSLSIEMGLLVFGTAGYASNVCSARAWLASTC